LASARQVWRRGAVPESLDVSDSQSPTIPGQQSIFSFSFLLTLKCRGLKSQHDIRNQIFVAIDIAMILKLLVENVHLQFQSKSRIQYLEVKIR
jgi:hypothetical protein